MTLIDRLREQIQHRLDQLAAEAEPLRKALAALDPRSTPSPARKAPASKPPARRPPARKAPARATADGTAAATKRPRAAAGKPKATKAAGKGAPARRTRRPAAASPRRTAQGATRAAVLAALSGGDPLTAGQVAEKTGLGRPTVSTTLSRLAKSGELQKAERGYSLAPAAEPAPAAPAE